MTTEEAVGELVNVAFRQFGGAGDADPIILRGHMEKRICSITGCGGNHYGCGYCSKHYKRWKKGDDLERSASKRSIADPRYFWAKVSVPENTDDACWEWQGSLWESGYGIASVVIDGISYQRAHRLAFYFATSHHPGEQFVLHKCDNRRCVNPKHLFLGSHADNMADMDAKGRRAVGEAAGHDRLTTSEVIQIKTGLQQGKVQKHLAAEFAVSRSTINAIAKGRMWRHVEVSA